MAAPLYDDGVYVVTRAVVATPTRFYPLANTTASLRRDPLWAAIGLSVLCAVSLVVYGDLLHAHERILLILLCAVSLVGGWELRLLCLDAVGHRRTLIAGRRDRIRRLYRVIRDARTLDAPSMAGSDDPEVA